MTGDDPATVQARAQLSSLAESVKEKHVEPVGHVEASTAVKQLLSIISTLQPYFQGLLLAHHASEAQVPRAGDDVRQLVYRC